MSDNKMLCYELYETLKGTRSKKGRLFIEGVEDGSEYYEELYFVLLESMKPVFKEDYWKWYQRTINSYIKFRRKNSTTRNIKTYHLDTPFLEHDVQMQLTIIKYYLYRRSYSNN